MAFDIRLLLSGATVFRFTRFCLVGGAPADEYRLSSEQLDTVTAAGGRIASIGPAKAEAAESALPKRAVQRRGGQITSI
jgi:hypothetical protein